MKLRDIDIKQIKMQDQRVRAFKERNFEACGYDASPKFFFKIVLISIAFALTLLFTLAIILS